MTKTLITTIFTFMKENFPKLKDARVKDWDGCGLSLFLIALPGQYS
jgi:hypothetical protein